jgi:lysophospholipase L1-like esterase
MPRRPPAGHGARRPVSVAHPLGSLAALAFVVCLAGCAPGTGDAPRGESGEPGSGYGRTAATASERGAKEAAAASQDVPETLDYVALGDSLAAGEGAGRGYVQRYAEHLRRDSGARVRVTNFGVNGQTAPELLGTLRDDPGVREALRGAEVVTFNIGINDLGEAGRSYREGTCGGPDDEGCLRSAVGALERDWDAVTAEILRLSPPDGAVVRTAGLGYTPDAEGRFEPYLDEVNRHIAASAEDSGVPHVEVHLGPEEISRDGVHPNGEGYAEISDRLRALGYGPLDDR